MRTQSEHTAMTTATTAANTAPHTTVVNLHHRKGRQPVAYDVYIGRSMPPRNGHPEYRNVGWGNPFKGEQKDAEGYYRLNPDGTAMDAVDRYAEWIQTQPHLLRRIPELVGKRLACWCKPKRCHGTVLAELANAYAAAHAQEEQEQAG